MILLYHRLKHRYRLGLVFHHILTGKVPYWKYFDDFPTKNLRETAIYSNNLQNNITGAIMENVPFDFSLVKENNEEYLPVLKRMLVLQLELRPSARELVEELGEINFRL